MKRKGRYDVHVSQTAQNIDVPRRVAQCAVCFAMTSELESTLLISYRPLHHQRQCFVGRQFSSVMLTVYSEKKENRKVRSRQSE